jgi:hypothetical protein
MSVAQKKEVSMSATGFFETDLADADPEVYNAIRQELGRQQDQI